MRSYHHKAATGFSLVSLRLCAVVLLSGWYSVSCTVSSVPTLTSKSAGPTERTVGDVIAGSCRVSTDALLGLSEQVIQQYTCLHPSTIVSVYDTPGLSFARTALPLVESSVASDVDAFAREIGSHKTIRINHGIRTPFTQHALEKWFNRSPAQAEAECGIHAVAPVGSSQHEFGKALDIANIDLEMRNFLRNRGWTDSPQDDPPHVEKAAEESSIRPERMIHAFQILYNRNCRGDCRALFESGRFDEKTVEALYASPAIGFPVGPSCPTRLKTFSSKISMAAHYEPTHKTLELRAFPLSLAPGENPKLRYYVDGLALKTDTAPDGFISLQDGCVHSKSEQKKGDGHQCKNFPLSYVISEERKSRQLEAILFTESGVPTRRVTGLYDIGSVDGDARISILPKSEGKYRIVLEGLGADVESSLKVNGVPVNKTQGASIPHQYDITIFEGIGRETTFVIVTKKPEQEEEVFVRKFITL